MTPEKPLSASVLFYLRRFKVLDLRRYYHALILLAVCALVFVVRSNHGGSSNSGSTYSTDGSELLGLRGSAAQPAQLLEPGDLGVRHVVLAGRHGGVPIVINLWLRTLCAGDTTITRGFATAEEANSPVAAVNGITQLPMAVLVQAPVLTLKLSNGSRVNFTSIEAVQDMAELPRDTWHVQVSYQSNLTALDVGVWQWNMKVALTEEPTCGFNLHMPKLELLPWPQQASVWGVLALHPEATTTTAALSTAVEATLRSLLAAGAGGLLVLTARPAQAQLLRASPLAHKSALASRLSIWLWDGPLHLRHPHYTMNHMINGAILAGWGSHVQLLVLQNPGDTLRLAGDDKLAFLTREDKCLGNTTGQIHLHRCMAGRSVSPLCAGVTQRSSCSSTTYRRSLSGTVLNATGGGRPAVPPGGTLLDPNLVTMWHMEDAAVITINMTRELLQLQPERLAGYPEPDWEEEAWLKKLAAKEVAEMIAKGIAPPVEPIGAVAKVASGKCAVVVARETPCPAPVQDPVLTVGAEYLPLKQKPKFEKKAQSKHPKIALMFFMDHDPPIEPIWKAWFEAASRVEFAEPPPLDPTPATWKDALGPGREMFPALGTWPDDHYPWHLVHNGTLGSDPYTNWIPDGPPRPPTPAGQVRPTQAFTESGMAPGFEPQMAGLTSWEYWLVKAEQERLIGEVRKRRSSTSGAADWGWAQPEGVDTMFVPGPEHPAYKSQHLFNMYVHLPLHNPPHKGSIFSGRQLAKPANTTAAYAQWGLVEAMIVLLKAALQDETNVKFAFMSGTSIPLYHPQITWTQMMSDPRSHIGICDSDDIDNEPWRRPDALDSPFLKWPDNWRKSFQWHVLNRPHADLIVKENHVLELFKRHCFTYWNNETDSQACISDEAAIPTTLRAYGMMNQTNCNRNATYSIFPGGWHPRTYTEPWQVNLTGLEEWRNCSSGTAAASAQALFTRAPIASDAKAAAAGRWRSEAVPMAPDADLAQLLGRDYPGMRIAKWVREQGYNPMPSECTMWTRKFGKAALNATLAVELGCKGVGLGSWCTERPGMVVR